MNMIGQTLGPYRITTEVARGGQATLYKAVHTVLGRETALKVLHPHLITVADFLQKFEAESRILARLKHPNIVSVYDAGVDKGLYWIAMEWLDGQAVDDLIAQQGKLPVDLAVRIADQVAAALEYAHAQGLIHRDIKPGNMMLLPDGMVKVLDFGIAAIIAAGQKAVTRIGTVEYMSYEQFNGQADHRSDIYSLGASLYEILTGQLPPRLALHPPAPPRQLNSAIPPALEQLLYHLLAHRPEARPQTAIVFRQELEAALTASVVKPAATIRCPQCGVDNRASAKYCRACGKMLASKVSAGWGPLKIAGIAPIAGPTSNRPQFVWSPQGDMLAVCMDASPTANLNALLYILHLTKVTESDSLSREILMATVCKKTDYCWSPDGWKIACVEDQQPHKIFALTELRRANYSRLYGLYGHDELLRPPTEQLTWGEDTDDDMPIWSPDGQLLLYRAKLRTTDEHEWRLLDLATKEIHRLGDARAAAWSPDGSQFVSMGESMMIIQIYNRYGRCVLPRHSVGWDIAEKRPYVGQFSGQVGWLDADRVIVNARWTAPLPWGSGISVLDIRSLGWRWLLQGASTSSFVVSPDRRWIAAARLSEDHTDSEMTESVVLIDTHDYAVIDLQSTTMTMDRGWASFEWAIVHAWSPDSTKVLFTRGREIWVVNINDTGLQRLTKGYEPQWSPDGRHIAFLRSPKEGEYELWVMRVETA
jgi:serine/threonine protein kinase